MIMKNSDIYIYTCPHDQDPYVALYFVHIAQILFLESMECADLCTGFHEGVPGTGDLLGSVDWMSLDGDQWDGDRIFYS
jgi:hypothetical protein